MERLKELEELNRLQNKFFAKIPRWYWIIIILEINLFIFLILPESVPLIWIRYCLGTIFVMYIPGYALVRSLYAGKPLDPIEQNALSIGLSLSLVPVIGFVLDLTPWRLGLSAIISTLVIVTTGVSTLALYQELTKISIADRDAVFDDDQGNNV